MKRINAGIAIALVLLVGFGPLVNLAAAQKKDLVSLNRKAMSGLARGGSSKTAGVSFSSRLLDKRPAQQEQAQASPAGATATRLSDGRLLRLGGLELAGPVASVTFEDPRTSTRTSTDEVRMQRARAFHSATMLPNGRVLIAGGIGGDGKIVDTPEIFDPEAQTSELLDSSAPFSVVNPRSSIAARVYHTATLMTEGLVLIAGGLSGDGDAARTADLWDFRTKQVAKRLKLTSARYGHSSRLLADGRVLLSGGSDKKGMKLESGELFDPARQSFSSIDPSELEALLNDQRPASSPSLAGSIPADRSTDVAPNALLALRFSEPLEETSVNAQSVVLSGSYGSIESLVVPAEGGMLAFVTPRGGLLPDSTYALSINSATDRDKEQIIAASISFTTSHLASPALPDSSGDDDWTPPESGTRENWRTNRKPSDWTSLPPLQAAPGVTALAGQALTLSGKPLANVTMKVGDRNARTDDTGRFLIENVQPGRRVLVIDGRSASKPSKTYGVFEAGVSIEAARTTAIGFTVWMPKLDTAHEIRIPSPTTSETVITTPLIPGLEVRIPAGVVIRDYEGKKVKRVGITPIPLDRPPFPLPKDVYVPIYFTVQPGGAYIESSRGGSGGYVKGARLIYPNYRREGSGTRFDFWHYDPEEKGWYTYGKGTVAEDQRQIVPDPGVSVHEFTGAMVALPSTVPGNGPAACNCASDGDPVDLGSGLFVFSRTDLVLPDTIPIALTRTYRPQDTISRAFGIGTTQHFEMFLVGDTNPWTYIDLILPDGARIHYDRISPGTSWSDAIYEHTTTPSMFYKSRIVSDPVTGWNVKTKDGTTFSFSGGGEGATEARKSGLMRIQDRYGNTLLATRAANGNLTKLRSPNGRYIDFSYDASNRVTLATDNIGRSVSYTYDASGRLWKVTDPMSGVTEYTYDSLHRMLTLKDARGIVYLTNEYDSNGRVIQQTQADNTTYLFAYTLDGNGKITETDVTDPRGNHRVLTFNSSGYRLTDTRGCSCGGTVAYERQAGTDFVTARIDALKRRTEYTYDSMGNPTSLTRMAGTSEAVTTTCAYEQVFNQIVSITDPLNHTTSYTYDASGNRVSVTDPLNHQVTATYDAAGRPISVTDAVGNTTQFGYDGGDLVTTTNSLGQATRRFLDAGGRALSITTPLGDITRYEYDLANRLTQVTDPLAGVIQFSYDANGNLLSLTDARNNVTSYIYDNMDRVQTRTDPQLHSEGYQYNPNGNVTQHTDRKGQVTTYTYDSRDRLSQVTYADSSTVGYSYDAVSRLTQASDSLAGTISYTYDNLNRLLTETTPLGTVSYTHDSLGRRTTMTVPGQMVTNYFYDNANRLTQIAQGTSSVNFEYDNANRPTSLALPNGVVTAYAYNAGSQLVSLTYKRGGDTLGSLTYEYDSMGRPVKVGGSYGRTNLPTSLTSASYNSANQQTAFGGQTLSYDLNGNLITDGTDVYTWDARDQLVSISGSVSASFQYDAVGRRRSKTIGGTQTTFVYDGDNVVQEQSSGAANILAGGLDEFFTRTEASGTTSLIVDTVGSTIALTDSAGGIQTQYTYEPFGKASTSGTSSTNTTQYTGRENDGNGLFYYRARYYSPSLQRFISEDPIGLAAGPNFYSYAANSPVAYTDPFGLKEKGNSNWVAVAAAGAAAAPALAPAPAASAPAAAVATEVAATTGGGAAGAGLGAFIGVGVCGLAAGWAIGRSVGHIPTGGGRTVDNAVQDWMVDHIWKPDPGPAVWPPVSCEQETPKPRDREKECIEATQNCLAWANEALPDMTEWRRRFRLCGKASKNCDRGLPTIFPHGETVK
jgi:RHS repeat-associated protein